jgi:DNA-binding NtrC family response regulator
MLKPALELQRLIQLNTYLFIGHPRHAIVQHLHSALKLHESLSITMRPDSKLLDPKNKYAIYILDADYLSETPSLIRKLRRSNPLARVLVISKNPSWETVRDAFRAGAMDMLANPTNCNDTRLLLDKILESQLPGDCRA